MESLSGNSGPVRRYKFGLNVDDGDGADDYVNDDYCNNTDDDDVDGKVKWKVTVG